jgi:hypothetical protein
LKPALLFVLFWTITSVARRHFLSFNVILSLIVSPVDIMVKTTYALTLFAAVSLAAPVPNPDGSGNLVGAGADSALGGAVQQLTHSLGMRDTKKTGNQHKNLIEEIPIIGKMLGNVRYSST